MVIWPDNIKEKDINDMVVSGIDYMNAINKNTFDGLMLRLKFNSWSKTT